MCACVFLTGSDDILTLSNEMFHNVFLNAVLAFQSNEVGIMQFIKSHHEKNRMVDEFSDKTKYKYIT